MDNISLSGMEFYGYHGCLQEENQIGQRFIVDLVLNLDLSLAGKTDDLHATINYAEVYDVVKAIVEGKPVKLIECLAENISQALHQAYPRLDSVSVTIHKPGAPVKGIFHDLSITIQR